MVSMLGGFGFFAMGLKSDIKIFGQALLNIERRLNTVEQSLNATNQALIQIAKQEVRLDHHAERISDLETRNFDHKNKTH